MHAALCAKDCLSLKRRFFYCLIMKPDNSAPTFSDIRQIGELSDSGIFIYDLAEKRLVYMNKALVTILEINRKLLREETDVVINSIDEGDRDYLKLRFSEMLQKGSAEDVQMRITRKEVQKNLSVSAYLVADKTCVIGFVRDISKIRQHEEYLINFGARKDALLDSVSQNLSTPLNMSKFMVDLIEKAVKEEKYDKLRTHVKVMREVTSESIRIIDKFLQEEHLESPRVDPKANRFDAMGKILIVLDKLREANPGKQFKIRAASRHLMINADEVKFFQIIHNLISNSIKFTKADGLIEVSIKEFENHIEIVVSDDGIGIPEKLLPFIFEKNTRAARKGLRGEVSNGIGLYVVNQLTSLLNGSISCESSENSGTKFTLTLPKEQ